MRTPTENQYGVLLTLANGCAGLAMTRRTTKPLLNHGWVTAEDTGTYFNWVRITPDGLRALAAAVERFGLPDLGPKPMRRRRVCASCGDTRYRYEDVPAAEVAAA